MQGTLKTSIQAIQADLIHLDGVFSYHYDNAPANTLEPTREFLLAWHQVKTALENINAIKIEDITT